jgi:hypothetical protein
VSDERISDMPDIGALSGTERFPLVRTPTDGNNYTTALSSLIGLLPGGGGGLSFRLLPADTRAGPATVALPTGNPAIAPIVYDAYGTATVTHSITITGALFPLGINMAYGSIPFFWTGSAWFPF